MRGLKPFHLLSDFDGVWTEPAEEAGAVHQTLVRELGRLAAQPVHAMAPRVESFRDAIFARPDQYGWLLDEALTSYVDEDYFAVPAAIGSFIETSDETADLRKAVLREFESLPLFLDHCYHSTCSRFRATVREDLTAGAEPILRWLLEHGARITFVTNAPAEKVISWWGAVGLTVHDAREAPPTAGPLRVYGRAGKQWLGDREATLDFRGRRVRTDRPQYRQILERESPDMVIGDVLSLDLAQPLRLRVERAMGAPRHVVLMARAHTPAWVLDSVGQEPHLLDRVVRHVTELPRTFSELEAARARTMA